MPENEVTLVRYDAACRAIAAARSTDEVQKIRNAATAMRAYAKQAKNRQLELDAAEIRIRAERRVGELMRSQRETVGTGQGKRTDLGPKRTQVDSAKVTLDEAEIDKHLADRARKLADLPQKKFETLVTDWRARAQDESQRLTSDLFRAANPMAVHHSSETPEHYTPRAIIDRVVACLGAIDLDPCANPGKSNVPAANRYTIEDDGLSKPWTGRVYMNPPYGKVIDEWIEKLGSEYQAGHVSQAIALVPARPDTQWFRRLGDAVCCFVAGRLTFVGNEDPAPFPSAVFYLGEHVDKFFKTFESVGHIWRRIESARDV